MKEEYILQINDRLKRCEDVGLLDLILKILDKSIQEAA